MKANGKTTVDKKASGTKANGSDIMIGNGKAATEKKRNENGKAVDVKAKGDFKGKEKKANGPNKPNSNGMTVNGTPDRKPSSTAKTNGSGKVVEGKAAKPVKIEVKQEKKTPSKSKVVTKPANNNKTKTTETAKSKAVKEINTKKSKKIEETKIKPTNQKKIKPDKSEIGAVKHTIKVKNVASTPKHSSKKETPTAAPKPSPAPVPTPPKPGNPKVLIDGNNIKSMTKQFPPFNKPAVSGTTISAQEKTKKKSTNGYQQVQN